MPNNIVVYTAITGGRDRLLDNQCWGEADWICYTDDFTNECGRWQLKHVYDRFKDKVRNARIHKILSHQYVGEYKYSIWIDGNFVLKTPPQELLEKYLKNFDLAAYCHPDRLTMEEEVAILCQIPKHMVEIGLFIEQRKKYEGKCYSLLASSVLFRQHSEEMEWFNNAWWSELCRYGKRDQVSLPYVLNNSPIRVFAIPGDVRTFPNLENDDFKYVVHADRRKK